ncbi:MAG: hypothetical protein V2I43_14995, partial [Parvularcula sp.]|nr:hypothetical protein [Parvularcula sp.]
MRNLFLSATILTFSAAAPAFADHHKGSMSDDRPLIERDGDQVKLTNHAISGNELLSADLVDIGTAIGSVDEIILNDEGKIAFIGYETSRFRDLDGEGYLAAGDMKLEADSGFGLDVSLNNIDTKKPNKRMRLSESEQQSQMLSNILRDEIETSDGIYDVRDVVFSPSGHAKYIIASTSSGGFLREGDAVAIPFDSVTYRDGAWRSKTAEMPIMFIAFV